MVSQIRHENYTNPPRLRQFETRPRMLKDFLSDETFDVFPSSSKHGNSKSCGSTVVQLSSSSKSTVLLRCRSKRAAVSAIHRVINVVRLFQFATTKSPLILPRSFSRKPSAKNGDREGRNDNSETTKLVKVKDILRWRSFRDLAEDESEPLDLPSSPVNSASPMTFSSSSCSKKSSWCDSDFTAEELYENESFVGGKPLVGQRSTLMKNLKGEWQLEESAQQSPVSILDSPFREDILPRLENIKRARCRLMQRIEDLDSLVEWNTQKKPNLCNKTEIILEEERLANEAEAKATKLLKESNLTQFEKSQDEERLIFDFFVHELSINIGKVHDTYKFEQEIIGLAQSWLNGDYEESYEWEEEKNRVAYVHDMEKELCWKNFKQEQEEMTKSLEMNLLNELLDEFLDEVIC